MKKSSGVVLVFLVGVIGFLAFGYLTDSAYAQVKEYQEYDGIILFYTPKDVTVYRELLPAVFDLPDQPLVEIFVFDFYKMAPWALDPYQETAVLLMGTYKGKKIWHCITMPVTSEKARIGGIRNQGYPKVLADVAFVRKDPLFSAILKAKGKTIMELTLDTEGRTLSSGEKDWFVRLTGIPSLNLLNGKLIDPMPRMGEARVNILDLSEQYPRVFRVQMGKASLTTFPENVPKARDWRPKAFGIEVKEIVLAYYFQNKHGFSFGAHKVVSD
jgi:hypothetical protein